MIAPRRLDVKGGMRWQQGRWAVAFALSIIDLQLENWCTTTQQPDTSALRRLFAKINAAVRHR